MNLRSSSKHIPFLTTMITGFIGVAVAEMPGGWLASGNDFKSYEIGLDHNVSYTGRSSAYIKAIAVSGGFATLMQDFSADHYHGKRVRLSAHVKSANVKNWAGLWMRVDGKRSAAGSATLAFDNMANRPIRDTTDWTQYEVVLDVPEDALRINIGVLLHGWGTVWSDNFEFRVVDASVPVTGINSHVETWPKEPVNLDFEER
jgi:hypothetical protein